LIGSIGTHAINVSLRPNLPYDPVRDFVPIALLAESHHLLVLNPANAQRRGMRTLADFVRYAKAHPGELNMASAGNGTSSHLSGELFKHLTGTHLVHFPYRGTGPGLLDLLAGTMDLMFDTVASSLPYIQSGQLLPVALAAAHRSPALPQLPTFHELEIAALRHYEASAWWGLFAPAGTPPDAVQRLQEVTAKALAGGALGDQILAKGAVPGTLTGHEFAAYIAAETKKWAYVVKVSGAKVD
jgi:tripartite-type tricarboxylate transporter receptor subunit TctC